MSFLAKDLKHRIQIQRAVDTPIDDFGGLERSYETLLTIWAGIKQESDFRTSYVAAIRGQKIDEVESHEFTVRRSAVLGSIGRAMADGFDSSFDSKEVGGLGRTFNSAFDSGFDSIQDLMPLKSDYFIFLNTNTTVKGRLFRISRLKMDEANKEYFKIKAIEIEEHGTGHPE
jgi:hypothetical protein